MSISTGMSSYFGSFFPCCLIGKLPNIQQRHTQELQQPSEAGMQFVGVCCNSTREARKKWNDATDIEIERGKKNLLNRVLQASLYIELTTKRKHDPRSRP